MTGMRPQDAPPIRFFRVMMAFQHFAGKPMRATDAASVVEPKELDAMEDALRRIARKLREENKDEWAELHRLADQIDMALYG